MQHKQLDVDFVRAMARHSALRGDTVADLLRLVVDALDRPPGSVSIVLGELTGENVLAAHELDLSAALVEAEVPTEPLAGPAVVVALDGPSGPIAEIHVGVDPGADVAAVEALAEAVSEELSGGLVRHWIEQQHLDRAWALLEAQRHTHVGCFEWDIVADKVRWSDELYRIFGSEPQAFEPTFEEFLERVHPEDRDAVRASVYEAYEHHTDYRIEERIVRPDGVVRLLASWGHVIVDDASVPVKIVGSCQDVTDARAAAEELTAIERRLAEAQERRSHALELNDSVVQGLVAALSALEAGMPGGARSILGGMLDSVRDLVDDLLRGEGGAVSAADLVRSAPVAGRLVAPVEQRCALAASPWRVLIVDDSADIRLLVRMILDSESDFDVVGLASDGDEALATAIAVQPDLVLLDLAMPLRSGLDVLPELAAAVPDAVIVVFSGFPADDLARQAFEAGAHAYVEKGLIDVSFPTLLREMCSPLPGAPPRVVRAAAVV